MIYEFTNNLTFNYAKPANFTLSDRKYLLTHFGLLYQLRLFSIFNLQL
jgi:hypothetical protein